MDSGQDPNLTQQIEATERALLERKIAEQKREIELRQKLPHLHGFKHYKWSRRFFESRCKDGIFLLAANQIGKSSVQIRKAIYWATEKSLWKKLWPHLTPNQFWYLYPTKDVATIEFHTKWKQFLPDVPKDDPEFGWRAEFKTNFIYAIHFNSGVSIYFKTYKQDVQDLQTGSVFALFCFVAGTKVITPFGDKNIEDIGVGDFVLGPKGFNRVYRKMSRLSDLVEVQFSNGSKLIGSPEHPIWTDNGFVRLGNLKRGDKCLGVSKCDYLTKTLLFLRAKFILGNQNIKTLGKEIIGAVQAMVSLFTSQFGRPQLIDGFHLGTWFIMKMKTPSITQLKTWCYYRAPNIPEFIRYANGNQKNGPNLLAKFAEKNLKVEPLKIEFLGLVKRIADLINILKTAVKDVVSRFGLEKIKGSVFVQKTVQINPLEKKEVYNLSVENDHQYFANGILTHNCDEELPLELLGELQNRLNATDGYFHMVFTATLGQDYWRKVMEPLPTEKEEMSHALKLKISLFDCLEYEDGSGTHWTREKIQRIIDKQPTSGDVQIRVYGKFAKAGGRKYEAYDETKNRSENHPLPSGWHIYAGVDPGSGGEKGHPSAICFVAVDPLFRKGRVFRAWRGDGIPTTSGDTYVKYVELRADLKPVGQFYDWASAEFKMIAEAAGDSFDKAEKSHEVGERVLNTLFKHKMLSLQLNDPEIDKMSTELSSVSRETPKKDAVDDLCDALRYCVTKIPWDFAYLDGLPAKPAEPEVRLPSVDDERRGGLKDMVLPEQGLIDMEIEEWNERYGGY